MSELFNKNDVYSVLNVDEAKVYEDKKGYFGNSLDDLQRAVEADNSDFLVKVMTTDTESKPFISVSGPCDGLLHNALFLPVDRVKKVKNEYRPFTLFEFNETFKLGQIITFRSADTDKGIFGKSIYTGYLYTEDGDIKIDLAGHLYTLDELLETFEYQNTYGGWYKFGVYVGE